uniref:Protein FAR1-RELATED SEQUENCE n=1 Tax=Chenopodium quinoa TaxID=63459 RepID=A0A803LR27_CHEQI
MELNEEEVGDHEIEVLDLDLEVAEEVGVMDTPVVDVLGSGGVFEDGNDGNAATTPLRCVVESDEGAYKDLLDHPQVGMVFSSWEDADKFYRKYGKQRGFGVYRAAGNFKIENGKTDKSKRRSYIWHCECAGKADLRRRVNEKRVYGGGLSLDLNRRKTKKCGCPVEMRAVCKPDGCWEVRKAITAHGSGTDTIQKDVECDNTGMESSPSVNKDFVYKDSDSVMLHNDLGDSVVNERSALGLNEISIDPLHNTPTPMELVPNEGGFNCGSSVNENISAGDGSVQKPLSVGDSISRKKPHRPRAKRFLSFVEKCAKKASSARTKTTTKTNNVWELWSAGRSEQGYQKKRKAKESERVASSCNCYGCGWNSPYDVGWRDWVWSSLCASMSAASYVQHYNGSATSYVQQQYNG